LNLADSPEAALQDALSNAIAKIRDSRQKIQNLWTQIGAIAQP